MTNRTPLVTAALALGLLLPSLATAQANHFPVVGYGSTQLAARQAMVSEARAMCGQDQHADITDISFGMEHGFHVVHAWVTCRGNGW